MKQMLLILLISPFLLNAQKYDNIWVTGGYNVLGNSEYGGALIDFNFQPRMTYYHYREMNMFVCNVSISDTAGNLQFYSNGCDIAGADDTILANGGNINPGQLHYIDCIQNMRGYASNHQSAVILPLPDIQGVYYLFHESQSISYNPTVITTDKLLYSKVNMNNNKGLVTEKNILVMNDSLAYGEMNAVKHANGKDWWIITPKKNSNQFYIFLFTKDGVVDTLTQVIGALPPPEEEGAGQTTFSPNGDRMVRYYPHNPLMLYTFDRSTGHFTSYDTVSVNYGTDWAFEGGCAISPSGRYLYVAAMLNAYQFDLFASNISSTQTTVATWDGVIDPIIITFLKCQLGPDCKIYILGGGDTRYYHIIHNPDEPGLACNFEQRGLVLPTPSGASIPYFPNYRLGPIDNPGVPCTATVSVSAMPSGLPQIRSYPNPASEQLTIEWGSFISGSKRLTLGNTIGQPVKDLWLSAGSTSYVLSLEHLPAGVYFWALQSEAGQRIGSGKIVKQ